MFAKNVINLSAAVHELSTVPLISDNYKLRLWLFLESVKQSTREKRHYQLELFLRMTLTPKWTLVHQRKKMTLIFALWPWHVEVGLTCSCKILSKCIPTAVDELSCSQTNRQKDQKQYCHRYHRQEKCSDKHSFNISVNIPQNCKYQQSCCIEHIHHND